MSPFLYFGAGVEVINGILIEQAHPKPEFYEYYKPLFLKDDESYKKLLAGIMLCSAIAGSIVGAIGAIKQEQARMERYDPDVTLKLLKNFKTPAAT